MARVRRHPVAAFFVLAFAISWIVWFGLLLVPAGNPPTVFLATVIGAFGPAGAAIIVAATLNPSPTRGPPWRRWLLWIVLTLVILPLAITWTFVQGHPDSVGFYALCVVLSALSALVITGAIAAGRQGVRDLLGSLVRWRVAAVWWLVALLAWPMLIVISNVLSVVRAGGDAGQYLSLLSTIALLPGLVAFVTTLLIGAPLQEEPGWRGFAIPRLQERYSPLIASAIVGLLWQLWHLPLSVVGLYAFDVGGIADRLINFLPGALVFTWLFNRSKGSLLIVVLFHASLDAAPQILPAGAPGAGRALDVLVWVWALVVLVTDRMWLRLPASEGRSSEVPAAAP